MANEKLITTQVLIAKFEEALDDKWGYIWGTAGVMWTAARQEQLNQTTDSDRANSRKYGSKWIGHKVADCSGLFSWAFKVLGGYMYHGSNTMWDKYCQAKGELKNYKREDGKELLPGTAVYTYNASKKKRGHVGLYIGNGYVIEARGAYYGVVMTKLSSRPWAEWGELKGVDYSAAPVQEPIKVPDPSPARPTIRKGNKGAVVKEMQQMLDKLGYSLGICGVDGDYGVATEKAVKEFQRDHKMTVDGICGPATWKALEQAADKLKQPVKTYSVIISGLSAEQAGEIARIYPSAVIKEG